MDLAAIQSALRERNIDAWLFYDHHHRDPIAYRVLGLPASLMVTRRWFYLIPAEGEPVKLVHKIEAGHLDSLPGKKHQYSGWQELFDKLKSILATYRDLAHAVFAEQQRVHDFAGRMGVRSICCADWARTSSSSADLVAQFESTWSEEQIQSHFAARDSIDSIVAAAFKEIGRRVRNGGTKEHEIQQWFMEAFARENLLTDDPPIVAVNANAGQPALRASCQPSRADPRGRSGSARRLGQEEHAGRGLLRHYLDGIRGRRAFGADAGRYSRSCAMRATPA